MSTEPGLHRRSFLKAGAAATLGTLTACRSRSPRTFTGGIVGASSGLGHRLRDGGFPAPEETLEVGAVVVGGGVAGLAALRRLDRGGMKDTLLLELESSVGGNAACGQNAVSAYPWGAHYLPLPNAETTEVIALLEELKLITGRTPEGLPIYEETALCADPMERLLIRGRWQEGLLPTLGTSEADRREAEAFHAAMAGFRDAVGQDDAPAFAIPMEKSSRDPQWLELDRLTMAEWMNQQGWASAELRWYVDYCCRDDYGAGLGYISAWAGIHYFASRRGVAAFAEHDAVLTWPEGNGWIVRQIAEPLRDRLRPGHIVWRMESTDAGVVVDTFDTTRQRSLRIRARTAICATPRFIAQRLVTGLERIEGIEYSPWMVANITVDRSPTGRGVPLAWDNVFRDSPSIGYVVATHQSLKPVPGATVLTHYWPLDARPPADARQEMLARSYESWCDLVLTDLETAHPGLRADVSQLDVWLWGHGMIRPTPGYLWTTRPRLAAQQGAIFLAHSDMSGLSLFEEAYTRGVQAADAALKLFA